MERNRQPDADSATAFAAYLRGRRDQLGLDSLAAAVNRLSRPSTDDGRGGSAPEPAND